VQLASHSSVLNLVAEARLILSGAGAKYPMIALALMATCGGTNLQRACIADFPATVLSEAARAINTQEAARAVLLASARAEAGGTGAMGPRAIAALDARFDELGSAAINAGTVICEPDPLAMALYVFPVAQLAYYLYQRHHAPAVRGGPDLVSVAAAINFAPGGTFAPEAAFVPFCMAHYAAIKDHILFDPTPCFTNIVKALTATLTKVRAEVIEIYDDPDVDHPTKRWTGFVFRQEREVMQRRAQHGLALTFTQAELLTLMQEIQAFGEAAQLAQHATTHLHTITPTHAALTEYAQPGPAVQCWQQPIGEHLVWARAHGALHRGAVRACLLRWAAQRGLCRLRTYGLWAATARWARAAPVHGVWTTTPTLCISAGWPIVVRTSACGAYIRWLLGQSRIGTARCRGATDGAL
jgi:hypothetical protein